jgi:NAD-dependent dihydropyrimidine dehydrogenase PreA subunit
MAGACALWYPTIFPEKCDGCAPFGKPRCVEYCPNGVFTFQNGKAVVANPHKRISGCTACEPLCHKKAITFPKPQLAATPIKTEEKGLLRKTTCKRCGKVFWTNRESETYVLTARVNIRLTRRLKHLQHIKLQFY